MQDPLRILVVEDSPDDADLLLLELRRGGFDVTHQRVDTPEAMSLALDGQPWDAIVSDFSMPRFTGLAALELLRERGLDLPFILVSGTIGEDTAVHAMKAGANDYLMKRHLARLVPAVKRELRDAETRRQRARAEQQLRDARDDLEIRVRERTAELAATNAALTQEAQERKRAEAAAYEAQAAAEEANLAKRTFLANMSHEIRTPMAAILGYADMLLDPELGAAARLEHVQTIRVNAEHLLNVLNDILDLSKVEAGKLELEFAGVRPQQILAEAITLMRPRAIEKGLDLKLRYVGAVPQRIQTDSTRLRQILLNLLGNAIKFTEKGGVEIVVTLQEGPEGESLLSFEVIDSGIGMSESQISRLFQPFEQADSSTTRRFGGTGLGLSIVKRLAQMLGGDVKATSRPGHGSQFHLTIRTGSLEGVGPLDQAPESVSAFPAPAEPAVVQLRGRVLLAEDGIHNQKVISYYLRAVGLEVITADNGRIACEIAIKALSDAQRFDLILMDMQMPELDGYSATSRLRDAGYAGPIIALTAHAMSRDRDKCLQCGCTDYLTKPIDKSVLIATATRYLQSPSQPGADHSNSIHLAGDAGDDAEVRQFLPAFIADLPVQVSQLLALLQNQDIAAVRDLAHQIKGTAGMYGFMQLTDAARQLEQTLDSTAATEAIAAGLHSLVELIRRVDGYDQSLEAPTPITGGTT
jgi:signal transduction histidine kinase/HPt (histidine-containing phosphotransfer) domain-containing protein